MNSVVNQTSVFKMPGIKMSMKVSEMPSVFTRVAYADVCFNNNQRIQIKGAPIIAERTDCAFTFDHNQRAIKTGPTPAVKRKIVANNSVVVFSSINQNAVIPIPKNIKPSPYTLS